MATKTRKTSKANNPGPKPQVVSVAEFADELRKWWRFSNGQQHASGYHDREDFIAKKLPELLGEGRE